MQHTVDGVSDAVRAIASQWRGQRAERLARRALDRADFDQLREAGILTLIAPVDAGGLWKSIETSLRPMCEVYRQLGAVDPSVALVSSMHPAVLSFWVASPDAAQPDWEAQRQAVFASALAGEQWGTVTSEPGSGGDIARTRAVATPIDAHAFLPGRGYSVAGDKHFGSGFGVTDRMITTAVPQGEDGPTIFVIDARNRPWDGSAGLTLMAEWDGMGMAATQSHAMRLDAVPTVRLGWDGPFDAITRAAGPYTTLLFTAVVLGVLDEAVGLAREQLQKKAGELRAYEQVEWSRAELQHWTAVQAYEGGLRAAESGDAAVAFRGGLRAKEAVAELAEEVLLRLTRVLGGGTFSQRSPFAHWFEDVRALGFLRPPWGFAYDALFVTSLE